MFSSDPLNIESGFNLKIASNRAARIIICTNNLSDSLILSLICEQTRSGHPKPNSFQKENMRLADELFLTTVFVKTRLLLMVGLDKVSEAGFVKLDEGMVVDEVNNDTSKNFEF